MNPRQVPFFGVPVIEAARRRHFTLAADEVSTRADRRANLSRDDAIKQLLGARRRSLVDRDSHGCTENRGHL